MSLHFTSKNNVLVAIKKARREDDFEELRERIRSTIDWSCEHHEQVKGDLLASTLRAIHFAYDGHGENELLLLLGERTEAVFSRDADIKWAIMLGRVLLSMADKHRFIDHVNWLACRWDHKLCRLMSRVASRWGSDRYPDYSAEKVFCVGLSRTGTKSLDSALRTLGYDAAHWVNPISKNLLSREDYFVFDAFSDITVSAEFGWLKYRFPNAKFILTERDSSSWEPSVAKHYESQTGVKKISELVASLGRTRFGGRAEGVFQRIYGGFDRWEQAYAAHVDAVKGLMAADNDRFLRMDIVGGDSWGKLCGFLDKPRPSGEFPHA